jgi:integrase
METENATARDYLRLLLLTGMRRSEGLRLRWENVDLAGATLMVPDTKNYEPLFLPLSDYLLAVLSQRRSKTEESEWVFPAPSARGHLQEPKKFIWNVREKSGVSFTLHDLRRTFITIAESLDISAYALKRLLNHKLQSDVTAGYIVTDVERLRAPMQRITDSILERAKADKLKN